MVAEASVEAFLALRAKCLLVYGTVQHGTNLSRRLK